MRVFFGVYVTLFAILFPLFATGNSASCASPITILILAILILSWASSRSDITMSIDSATAYGVHLGPWTNWSKGRVLGATFTLTRQDGNLLIAFVAFFVALVGTRVWRLGCLVLHYVYSKDRPSDGLYHQRQAFLRNSPNPESALWTLADMGYSWKANAERVWTRLLPPLGVAVACFVGFTLASGFSSRVATIVSSEVLMSGVNCSLLRDTTNMTAYGDTMGSHLAQSMIAAENYARQCYSSVPSTGVSCGTYIKKQLTPAAVNTNASCPFDPKICKSTTGNLFIDTGLLDSHHDFGRNSPPNQRLQFRKTVYCAPLATEDYRVRMYDENLNQTYTTYYYGPLQNVNGSATLNYTTRFSNDIYPDIEELTHNAFDTVHDFSIRAHYSEYWNTSRQPVYSSFFPIPELKPGNGTISLYFLTSGRILFTSPSNDDWYGGTTNTTEVHKLRFSGWGNATFFRQSEPGSPLACRELEQYCYTGVAGQKCTLLQSHDDSSWQLMHDLAEQEDKEWLLARARMTLARVRRLYDPLMMLSTRLLIARDKLSGPILGPLPDNQWQLEVQHWHATTMAYFQYLFLESIIGFKDPKYFGMAEYLSNGTVEQKAECANQKIIAEGFVSVSIFGLVCIFVFGGLIIALSYVSSPAMSWCLAGAGRYQYAKLEWSTNDAFQLQRMAHEGTGMGTWSRGTQSIPVTRLGERLAVIDVANPKHPKLRAYGQPVNYSEQTDRQSSEDHDSEDHDSEDHDSEDHDSEDHSSEDHSSEDHDPSVHDAEEKP